MIVVEPAEARHLAILIEELKLRLIKGSRLVHGQRSVSLARREVCCASYHHLLVLLASGAGHNCMFLYEFWVILVLSKDFVEAARADELVE